MSTTAAETREPLYRGLRMTADEYYQLEDDGFRYELIDGVVCMSPSPTPRHQSVAVRIASQIMAYLEDHPVGQVFTELDVHLGMGPHGGGLVYRPDVVFLRTDQHAPLPERVIGAPDLVVEIVSDSSRRMDRQTKKDDYERCGVREYWVIDPELRQMTFYRLESGRYVEVQASGDSLASEVIPGFELDLERVRRSFRP